MPRDDAAVVAQDGGVEEGLAAARGIALDAPDENPERAIRKSRDAIALREVGVDEAAVIQQVARRVARRGQLREDEQVGARLAGARAPRRRSLRKLASNAPTVKFNWARAKRMSSYLLSRAKSSTRIDAGAEAPAYWQ